MRDKILVNAILVGVITTLSLLLQAIENVSIWWSPVLSAVITGIIIAIKEYLQNTGALTNKGVGAKRISKRLISLIGII